MRLETSSRARGSEAYSLPEVVIASVIVLVSLVALYAGFSAGFSVMKAARENLRATQILVQRAEVIRLYNWTQFRNTNDFLKPTFTEFYDPLATANSGLGVQYVGTVRTNGIPGLPAAYANNMRAVTITLYWTNRIGKTNVTFSRSLQTYVARYGVQNYVYGPR